MKKWDNLGVYLKIFQKNNNIDIKNEYNLIIYNRNKNNNNLDKSESCFSPSSKNSNKFSENNNNLMEHNNIGLPDKKYFEKRILNDIIPLKDEDN